MIYRIYGEKDTTIYELNNRKARTWSWVKVLEVPSSLMKIHTQYTW